MAHITSRRGAQPPACRQALCKPAHAIPSPALKRSQTDPTRTEMTRTEPKQAFHSLLRDTGSKKGLERAERCGTTSSLWRRSGAVPRRAAPTSVHRLLVSLPLPPRATVYAVTEGATLRGPVPERRGWAPPPRAAVKQHLLQAPLPHSVYGFATPLSCDLPASYNPQHPSHRWAFGDRCSSSMCGTPCAALGFTSIHVRRQPNR
jgi:hypothetical protein